jgi:hypothetical protein
MEGHVVYLIWIYWYFFLNWSSNDIIKGEEVIFGNKEINKNIYYPVEVMQYTVEVFENENASCGFITMR